MQVQLKGQTKPTSCTVQSSLSQWSLGCTKKSDEGWAIVNRDFYLLQSMLYDRIVTSKNISWGSHIWFRTQSPCIFSHGLSEGEGRLHCCNESLLTENHHSTMLHCKSAILFSRSLNGQHLIMSLKIGLNNRDTVACLKLIINCDNDIWGTCNLIWHITPTLFDMSPQ